MATFAERLRELREKAGLTQEQVARRADVSLGTIRNYEQRSREPSWFILFKLADAIGVEAVAFKDCVPANHQGATAPVQAKPTKGKATDQEPPAAKGEAKKSTRKQKEK